MSVPSDAPTIFPHVTRSPRSDSFKRGSETFFFSKLWNIEYSVGNIGDSRDTIKSGEGSILDTRVIKSARAVAGVGLGRPDDSMAGSAGRSVVS